MPPHAVAAASQSASQSKVQKGTGTQDLKSASLVDTSALKDPQAPKTLQEKAEEFYAQVNVQITVAIIIIANFVMNMVEKQIDPDGDKYVDVWYHLELFFNIVFLVELLLNMFGSWFWKFWRSSWNIFDFIVVAIGTLDMANAPLPGHLKLLRMMRAFRVFRLFNRVKSLQKIVGSLARAVPGVANAFLIMLIVMCIFAVLGVEFYRWVGSCGGESWKDGVFETSRQMCFGDEYFGTFSRSLYTLFQILTGDSWSEAVVRPILLSYPIEPYEKVGSAVFFVGFVIINYVVLINVVVAVLLDKMQESAPESAEEDVSSEPAQKSDASNSNINNAQQEDPVSGDDDPLADLRDKVKHLKKDVEGLHESLASFQKDLGEQVSSITTILQTGMTL